MNSNCTVILNSHGRRGRSFSNSRRNFYPSIYPFLFQGLPCRDRTSVRLFIISSTLDATSRLRGSQNIFAPLIHHGPIRFLSAIITGYFDHVCTYAIPMLCKEYSLRFICHSNVAKHYARLYGTAKPWKCTLQPAVYFKTCSSLLETNETCCLSTYPESLFSAVETVMHIRCFSKDCKNL